MPGLRLSVIASIVCFAFGVPSNAEQKLITAPPTSFRTYDEEVGKTFTFEVVGDESGNVFGTDVYTYDSKLATAAIHAGLIKQGEKALVKVQILPGQNRYIGSTRNGVKSADYDASPFVSYRFRADKPGSAIAKPEQALSTRTVVVWPLAFFTDAQGKHGGVCNPARITVGGDVPGVVQVAFVESEVGGAGPQWRAAGWTAALTAAELTDFLPLTTQATFNAKGRIDGPSAGALMTIGLLAAARGDTVRPEVTMTGTINPDGLIGPVGGIVHKIEGAAKAGKKVVVIPPGIARQEDENTGLPNDLADVGRRLGVKVVSALDIYEAYQLLTGAELPRPPEMKLAKQPYEWYLPAFSTGANWAGRRRDGDVGGIEGRISEEAFQLFEKSKKLLSHEMDLNREGEFATEVRDIMEAVRAQYQLLALVRCRDLRNEQGIKALMVHVRDGRSLDKEEAAAAASLKGYEILTIEQLIEHLQGLDAFLEGVSQREAAKRLLDLMPADSEMGQYDICCKAAVFDALALVSFQFASDHAANAKRIRGAVIPDGAPLQDLADFYWRGGDANEAVLTALIVDPQAKAQNVTASEIATRLMFWDRQYAVLTPGKERRVAAIGRYFPKGGEHTYAILANGIYTHCRASMQVAKYYSLKTKFDARKEFVGLEHERTFYDWLDASDRATARNIASVDSVGINTVSSRMLYDVAHVIRGREDILERLEALLLLFRANVETRIMLRLTKPASHG